MDDDLLDRLQRIEWLATIDREQAQNEARDLLDGLKSGPERAWVAHRVRLALHATVKT